MTDDRVTQLLDDPSAAPRDEGPAPEIEGYALGPVIARGGQATVYAATRRSDGRAAAVKVLRGAAGVSAYAQATFAREVALVRAWRHPNVVALYDDGVFDDARWFAMERCDGGSLADRCAARGAMRADEANDAMEQLLTGLSYVHARGVVHRDVKPGNVLLADGGRRVVLADFGIAKRVALAGASGVSTAETIVGTERYMAPEQREASRHVRASADVWSAAATYLFMRTARAPGLDGAEALGDEAVREVIGRALTRNPAGRYEDALAMRAAWRQATGLG